MFSKKCPLYRHGQSPLPIAVKSEKQLFHLKKKIILLHKARVYLGFNRCHGNNVTGVHIGVFFEERKEDETKSSLIICGHKDFCCRQTQIHLIISGWLFTIATTFIYFHFILLLPRNTVKGGKPTTTRRTDFKHSSIKFHHICIS